MTIKDKTPIKKRPASLPIFDLLLDLVQFTIFMCKEISLSFKVLNIIAGDKIEIKCYFFGFIMPFCQDVNIQKETIKKSVEFVINT